MNGESNLSTILRTLEPRLNIGQFVFSTIKDLGEIDVEKAVFIFREHEAITVVLEKSLADAFHLRYSYVAAWITLTVHSSLHAVGLTAVFSKALAEAGISCNVVAGYYHDHIFVAEGDASKALLALNALQ